MLLNGDSDQITDSLRSMNKDIDKIESDIMNILLHMKGAITIGDAYNMSIKQMELAVKAINDYYKAQKDLMD